MVAVMQTSIWLRSSPPLIVAGSEIKVPQLPAFTRPQTSKTTIQMIRKGAVKDSSFFSMPAPRVSTSTVSSQ